MTRSGALLASLLLLLAPAVHGDTRSAQFAVEIRLTRPGSAPAGGCTSSSGAVPAGGSVQVRCSDPVFVDIARVAGLTEGRYIRGVRLGVEAELPDYCREEPLGLRNAVAREFCARPDMPRPTASDDSGWAVADRLYAEADGDSRQAALRRWREGDASVTSLHVSSADQRVSLVELLVSF